MINEDGLHKLLNLGRVEGPVTFIVFSNKISNRLSYVCEFIFNSVFKVNFILTENKNEFEASTLAKINYSDTPIINSFQIFPSSLLFEKGVNEKKPTPEFENNLIYFFKNNKPTNFHFDVFASVFYFVSRYEEWQNYEKDAHGRFELNQSILFKNNFHLRPVVDIWIEELKLALQIKYTSIQFPKREFKIIATIDVDNLYAYKSKGFVRTFGASLKDLLRFDFKNLTRRIKVISNKIPDPFDIYEDFSKFCNEKNISLIYFFLFKGGTKFDRTVNPLSNSFNKAFESIKRYKAFIGLHPSYYSSKKVNLFTKEVNNFSHKLNMQVKLSRQHYLIFDIRTTPNLLLENKILADFSMGFASGAGFRAGTSMPFYYYNISAEEKTNLLLVPFCAMDGAYFIYNKMDTLEAQSSMEKIKEEIKKLNGLFITVFHERTFAQHLYKGFGEMYKKLLSN
jgi:hypothetical protein